MSNHAIVYLGMDQLLTLRPYESNHFPILERWITGSDMLFHFAGTEFTYPITEDQVFTYRAQHLVRPWYVAYKEDEPVAFGELIPQDDGVPRLARLLIGEPAKRGKGIGSIFVKALVDECIRLYAPPAVELYVWNGNLQAIRCYEKCRFTFLPNGSLTIYHEGRPYLIRKMRLWL